MSVPRKTVLYHYGHALQMIFYRRAQRHWRKERMARKRRRGWA